MSAKLSEFVGLSMTEEMVQWIDKQARAAALPRAGYIRGVIEEAMHIEHFEGVNARSGDRSLPAAGANGAAAAGNSEEGTHG